MKRSDKIIIIGIGNNTRQDDGIGWAFLDKLQERGIESDMLVYKYQLMVEDAEMISNFQKVYFIDACKSELPAGFEIVPIVASEEVAFSTHFVPPDQVLNLSDSIYQKKPKAFAIKIQGYQWDIEMGLSKQANANLNSAFDAFLDKESF